MLIGKACECLRCDSAAEDHVDEMSAAIRREAEHPREALRTAVQARAKNRRDQSKQSIVLRRR
jgi:hypothetical protein